MTQAAMAGLDLPPPFRVVTAEPGTAFAHAKAIAADQGAGTLVDASRLDLADFALVLEPAESLRTARRALYIGLCALGDALGALAPAEKPIDFLWPGSVRVDGGLIGGVRLGWPDGGAEDEDPEWLVFGATIRMMYLGEDEPGRHPSLTALNQEGFEDVDGGRLVESFARHLMLFLDLYQEQGFEAVRRHYLARLSSDLAGRIDIGENGDLLVRDAVGGAPRRHTLAAALADLDRLDPMTGAPRP